MRLVPKEKAVAEVAAGGAVIAADTAVAEVDVAVAAGAVATVAGGAGIAAATADATARFFSVSFLPNLVRAENSPNRRREICVRRVARP